MSKMKEGAVNVSDTDTNMPDSEEGISVDLRSCLSGISRRIYTIRRYKSFGEAHWRFHPWPKHLSRLLSLPVSRQSLLEYESTAQPLLELPVAAARSLPPPATVKNLREVKSNISLEITALTSSDGGEVTASSPFQISPETTTACHVCDGGKENGEAAEQKNSSNNKVWEWTFAIANLINEVSMIVIDQFSSRHNSIFLPLCGLMSLLAFLLSMFEFAHKVQKEKAIWKWRAKIPWFYLYNESQIHVPLRAHVEVAAVFCAIGQYFVAIISYCSYLRNGKNPVNISIWGAIFAFCQLCSVFFKDLLRDVPKQQEGVSSTELASSAIVKKTKIDTATIYHHRKCLL